MLDLAQGRGILHPGKRGIMAEKITVKVKCHACGYEIHGTAKYGSGHYVPEGVPFDFVAIGKFKTEKGNRVKAEVTCTCPKCEVKNKYVI